MDSIISSISATGVLSIQFNRPEKKNAITSAMYSQISQLLNDANQNPAIKCVVITGQNDCFTAGNDLHDFLNSADDEELAAIAFIYALTNFNKPLIAAVSGLAVGIGSTLLLHCDYVLATADSQLKMPFTQLGLCPEAGSSLLLQQKLGYNLAFELLVLGQACSGQRAFELGLVNQLCDAESLSEQAQRVANKLAALPADSVMTSKALIKSALNKPLKQCIEAELDQFQRLLNSDDTQQIIQQFFKAK